MASPNIYSAGLNLAGTVFANGPATLQRGGPVYFSGGIQWVDTISGSNANAGTLPELPVATLAQAITNSSAGGAIIIGAGSSESLVASQSFGALIDCYVFGCGTGSSRPRYTCTGAVNMWNVAPASVWIEGFYFPASTAAATSRILTGSDGIVIKDCYFECGASDTNRAVNIATNLCRVVGCSFVVTASRPATGVQITNATTDATIEDCVFDGGSYGWSDYALKSSGAATRTKIIGGTFSNRSDIGFTVTGTTYKILAPKMDGTSNVRLDA